MVMQPSDLACHAVASAKVGDRESISYELSHIAACRWLHLTRRFSVIVLQDLRNVLRHDIRTLAEEFRRVSTKATPIERCKIKKTVRCRGTTDG
jgi:hypothetical protein